MAEVEKYLDSEEGRLNQFQLMADIITKPKHDAKWWMKHTNPMLERLFEAELVEILKKAYGDIDFF
jgi:hypothetical protein